jgi:hypothetical protein
MDRTVPMTHTTYLLTPSSGTESSEASELGGLYEHRARPEWGLATRIANNDGRTAFQFADGRLRTIANSHVHLMDDVDRPGDESERLQQELAAMAGLTLARRSLRDAGDEMVTLDGQVRMFLEDFEGGFADPSYLKKHRGSGQRSLKRHRDPASAKAGELLNRGEMLKLIAAYRHDTVMERVIELLTSTSLVDERQLAPLRALDDGAMRHAVAALSDLLYGDVDLAAAVQAWIDALASAGMGVSWPLATAVAALAQPRKHLCVRESVLRHQMRWMAPHLRMAKVPSGKLYVRLRAVALRLMNELEARDLIARDLLDVYDFVWLTLRPAARKRIAAMPPAPIRSRSRMRDTQARGENAPELSSDAVAA